jgi:hypothetical protein
MHHWKFITLLAVLALNGSSIHAQTSGDPQPPTPSHAGRVALVPRK